MTTTSPNGEYRIETISELLNLDPDQLNDCLRDVEYANNMHHWAFDDQAPNSAMSHWKDDNNRTRTLVGDDGELIFTLKVTKDDPA